MMMAIGEMPMGMKVLHLVSTFFPQHTGGKEVFIYQLIKGNPEVDQLVVYHNARSQGDSEYDGIPVRVLPPQKTKDHYRSYWSLLYDGLPGFKETLHEFRPDLVHFHDFCAGASLSHLRYCRKAGIKTIVTYHAPGSSCMQKGLIRAGSTPCDGEILNHRCTTCRYQINGFPKALASGIASFRLPFDKRGRFVLRNSSELFHQSFREFFETVDAVQVHASWVRDLLIRNKVSPTKIYNVRLGGHASLDKSKWLQPSPDKPLQVVFIGRCVDIKGAHILIEAVNMLPRDARIEVNFLGPYWDDSAYGRQLQEKTKGDPRFRAPRLVPPEMVIRELSKMDVCVIPSLWPETGPLSLFDAFAAGVPVIGTNHAGIAERVRHGENGLLFAWGDSNDLARQLRKVIDERSMLNRFKNAIAPNVTFREMASDFGELYTKIIN